MRSLDSLFGKGFLIYCSNVQRQTFGFNLITYNGGFQVDKHGPGKRKVNHEQVKKSRFIRYLGTCFPDPVSAKKVLKESSLCCPMDSSVGIVPSG